MVQEYKLANPEKFQPHKDKYNVEAKNFTFFKYITYFLTP